MPDPTHFEHAARRFHGKTGIMMIREELACLGPHGFHRLAYFKWTDPGAVSHRPIICVHGLTRNARDFDYLAERLARLGPVYVPDMPGRGESPWLEDKGDYGYPLYIADIAQLIARTGAAEVDLVGTSMGGIIGMMLASQPGTPIRRLVINDIGALIPGDGLQRISGYVTQTYRFADVAEAERAFRAVLGTFGKMTDDQWRHMAEHGVRPLPEGGYSFNYDPAIATVFKGNLEDVPLWSYWDAIRSPTLVIRGSRSDLLRADTVAEMQRRGPPTELYEVEGAGHAPSLMAPDQIDVIQEFLAR